MEKEAVNLNGNVALDAKRTWRHRITTGNPMSR